MTSAPRPGQCGGGGVEKHPLLEMLFKVEGERENHPGFSLPPLFRPLPLSPLVEPNQESWEI